jgi:hypothetical protein
MVRAPVSYQLRQRLTVIMQLCNKCGLRERKHAKSSQSSLKDGKTRAEGQGPSHPISIAPSGDKDLELPPIRNPEASSGISSSSPQETSRPALNTTNFPEARHPNSVEAADVPPPTPTRSGSTSKHESPSDLHLPPFPPVRHPSRLSPPGETPHLQLQTHLPPHSQPHSASHAHHPAPHTPSHSNHPHSVPITPVDHHFPGHPHAGAHGQSHGYGFPPYHLPRIQTPSSLHPMAEHHLPAVPSDPYHHPFSHLPRGAVAHAHAHSPISQGTPPVHHGYYHQPHSHSHSPQYPPSMPIVQTMHHLPPIQSLPNQEGHHFGDQGHHHHHVYAHGPGPGQLSNPAPHEMEAPRHGYHRPAIERQAHSEYDQHPHQHPHASHPHPHQGSFVVQPQPHAVPLPPHQERKAVREQPGVQGAAGSESYNKKVVEWMQKNQRSQSQQEERVSPKSARRCFNCAATTSHSWRSSVMYPGQSVSL